MIRQRRGLANRDGSRGSAGRLMALRRFESRGIRSEAIRLGIAGKLDGREPFPTYVGS